MGFGIAAFDRPTLNHLYREIFARQQYYFRAETESPLILDCGANLGMASLYFKWLYPKARVRAFEPDPSTFELLKQNLARNGVDVSRTTALCGIKTARWTFLSIRTTPEHC